MEESSTASHELDRQAKNLLHLVSFFNTNEGNHDENDFIAQEMALEAAQPEEDLLDDYRLEEEMFA